MTEMESPAYGMLGEPHLTPNCVMTLS